MSDGSPRTLETLRNALSIARTSLHDIRHSTECYSLGNDPDGVCHVAAHEVAIAIAALTRAIDQCTVRLPSPPDPAPTQTAEEMYNAHIEHEAQEAYYNGYDNDDADPDPPAWEELDAEEQQGWHDMATRLRTEYEQRQIERARFAAATTEAWHDNGYTAVVDAP